jgi:hypothetical protein
MCVLTLITLTHCYHLLPLATTIDAGAYTLLYAGVILQATIGNAALPELSSTANIISVILLEALSELT